VRVSVYLDADELRRLDFVCWRRGTGRGAALREALSWTFAKEARGWRSKRDSSRRRSERSAAADLRRDEQRRWNLVDVSDADRAAATEEQLLGDVWPSEAPS
jgi:hypothetical protein